MKNSHLITSQFIVHHNCNKLVLEYSYRVCFLNYCWKCCLLWTWLLEILPPLNMIVKITASSEYDCWNYYLFWIWLLEILTKMNLQLWPIKVGLKESGKGIPLLPPLNIWTWLLNIDEYWQRLWWSCWYWADKGWMWKAAKGFLCCLPWIWLLTRIIMTSPEQDCYFWQRLWWCCHQNCWIRKVAKGFLCCLPEIGC